MSPRGIERRLAAVEHEIARLKAARHWPAQAHPIHALEKVHGTFENDEAFKEAARLGRKSQRPSARKSKGRRR
jgi:hypothetical protein